MCEKYFYDQDFSLFGVGRPVHSTLSSIQPACKKIHQTRKLELPSSNAQEAWTDLISNLHGWHYLETYRNSSILSFSCQDIHGGGEEEKGAVPATIKRRYLCEYSWSIDIDLYKIICHSLCKEIIILVMNIYQLTNA